MLRKVLVVLLLSHACMPQTKQEAQQASRVSGNIEKEDSLILKDSPDPIGKAKKIIDTLHPFDGQFDVPESDKWTTISFPEFNLALNGEFWLEEEKRGDTLFLQEEVGEYIYGRQLKVVDLDSNYRLKAYLSLKETIWQTYAYRPEDSLIRPNYDTFNEDRSTYQNWTDDQFIPFDAQGSFRIPMLTENSFNRPRPELIEKLQLDTTNYHIPGEMGGTHIYFYYLDKPAVYSIGSALFRFDLIEENGTIKMQRYLQIYFSYGC